MVSAVSQASITASLVSNEKSLSAEQRSFLSLMRTNHQVVYDIGHSILSSANEPISIDPSGKNFLPLAATSWKSLNDSDALALIESRNSCLGSYSIIAGLAASGVSVLITNHSSFMTRDRGVAEAEGHIATQLKKYSEPQTGFGKVIFLSPEIITSKQIPW